MLSLRKSKIVKNLKGIKPRLKWLVFSQVQDYKIKSDYINLLCTDSNKSIDSDSKRIESMVEETLVKEFSPSIKNSKSYRLLVDTIVHKIKKEQSGADNASVI